MIYAKKTFTGHYQPVDVSTDAGSSAATHIVITREDYKRLVQERDEALKKAVSIETAATLGIEKIREECKKDKETAVGIERERANKLQVELDDIKSCNDNLRRICKERANAKRKIPNKKQHQGYLVLSSSQYQYRYNKSNIANVWKTVIQSPVDASLPFFHAQKEIMNELLQGGICYSLGMRNKSDSYSSGSSVNTIFSIKHKANYKSGLWETELLHTHSVKVPEELRL